MARTKAELSAGARLSDFLTVGFLAMQCPVDTVRHALQKNGAQSKRRRGLPHEVLVYFVMMMVLYGNVAYEDVMRLVVEGLRTLLGDTALERSVVTKGAISQARSSVGEAPLRQLYEEQVRPHGPKAMPGVMFYDHRVMAIDGSTLTMPDEKANSGFYGHLSGGYGDAAFPVIRFVGMTECGTHTICFAKHGPFKEGELTLAQSVMDQADESMIVTADRGFCGYEFWQRGLRCGAKLLFRVKKSQSLRRLEVLPDGSYLSEISSNKNLKQKVRKTVVRVIEYTLDGVPGAELSYRLITNWMGDDAPPAVDLAALYHRRWTIEESFDELKTHLADRKVILRSKTPELVRQEFYALLLAHAAIRKLMTEAADRTQQSAGDLSFVHAVRVLQRRLPSVGAIPPSASAGVA
jgi:Insertion element 4 transposase N-terminal/Transposase DDE domain